MDGKTYGFTFEESPANSMQGGQGYETATITLEKVTKAMVASYLTKLSEAGYELLGDLELDNNYQNVISAQVLEDTGIGQLYLYFYPNTQTLEILVHANLDTSRQKLWPAAAVAEAAQCTKDSVPEFKGTNRGFGVHTAGGYTYVVVYVENGQENAALNTYKTILSSKEYTPMSDYQGQPRYRSPNGEVALAISCQPNQYPGQIEILIMPIAAVDWPAAEIARRLAQYDISVDTLPALTTPASEIKFAEAGSDYDLRIRCNVGNASIDDAYDDYDDALDKAHFAADNNTHIWTSPSGEYTVKLDDDTDGNFYIKVKAKYGVWPSDIVMAAFYQDLGAEHDIVPEPLPSQNVPKARDYTISYQFKEDYSAYYRIICKYLSATDAASALADYIQQLNIVLTPIADDAAGHKHFKTYNEELDISVFPSDGGKEMYIDFDKYTTGGGGGGELPPEPVEWPEDDIKGYVGDYDIPNLAIDGVLSYEVNGNDSMNYACITYNISENTAPDAVVDDILEILCDLLYENEYDNDLEAYVCTNNGELKIIVSIDPFENQPVVEIMLDDAEPEKNWENAAKAISDQFNGEHEIPDLSFDNADTYEVLDSELIIILKDQSEDAINDAFTSVAVALENAGYHYSKAFGSFININKGLEFAIAVDLDMSFHIFFGEYEPYGEGFGLVIASEDWSSIYYEVGAQIDDSYDGFKQYYIERYEFHEGDIFFAYDYTHEQDFYITIDEASLGLDYSSYIEWDNEQGAYVVKQDFTADVYVKIKNGQDQIYFDLITD